MSTEDTTELLPGVMNSSWILRDSSLTCCSAGPTQSGGTSRFPFLLRRQERVWDRVERKVTRLGPCLWRYSVTQAIVKPWRWSCGSSTGFGNLKTFCLSSERLLLLGPLTETWFSNQEFGLWLSALSTSAFDQLSKTMLSCLMVGINKLVGK